MTPMVRVCCLRRERATTLGRYFISAAAAKTRSWVILGMERAAGAEVRTRETVAAERPRWSAIVLRPTERGCWSGTLGRLRATFFSDFAMPKSPTLQLLASNILRRHLTGFDYREQYPSVQT